MTYATNTSAAQKQLVADATELLKDDSLILAREAVPT